MLFRRTSVQHWEPRAYWLKLRICRYGGDPEATMVVQLDDRLEFGYHCGDLSIWECLDSSELDLPRCGDKKRNSVDEHDVDRECDATMEPKDTTGDRIRASFYVSIGSIYCLSFERSKVFS
jgi:hypothetical protein